MDNDELISSLISKKYLKTPLIVEAFKNVDRKDFVLPEYRSSAYLDEPLPIGHGATISQPLTVAFMLELLQPKPGEKILDVGSGSGWTTSLLAYCVASSARINADQNADSPPTDGIVGDKRGNKGLIIGVERISELVEFGRKNLEKYKFINAKIVQAGEKLGYENEAPYDKILVSAAADNLPEELVAQFKIGGRMVIPIGHSIWKIEKVSEKEIKKEEYRGFSFVTLARS